MATPPSEPLGDPLTWVAGDALSLIFTCEALIVMSPLDLNVKFAFACELYFLPDALKPSLVPTFSALLWTMMLSFALISMSPAHWIWTSFCAASRTILFFRVLSTMTIFSEPSLSSKITR